MSNCPCCSDRLLRHIRQGSLYWFCRTCWSEMPNLEMYDRALATSSPVLEPAGLKPFVVHSGRSAAAHPSSHFAKVIQHQRPGKTNSHLLVS